MLDAGIAAGLLSLVKGLGWVRHARFWCCGVFAVEKAVVTKSLVEQIVEFTLASVRYALVFFLLNQVAVRFQFAHLPVWDESPHRQP